MYKGIDAVKKKEVGRKHGIYFRSDGCWLCLKRNGPYLPPANCLREQGGHLYSMTHCFEQNPVHPWDHAGGSMQISAKAEDPQCPAQCGLFVLFS